MLTEPAKDQFIEGRGTATLTDQDKSVIAKVEDTLATGVELKRWWEQKDKAVGYAERFDLVREYNRPDQSFGFFDTATVGGKQIPVMGVVQEMLYDKSKQAAGEKVRDEFREFALRYFMRVSAFRQPEAYAESGRRPPASYLRVFSWYPESESREIGFGFSQHYYKLHEGGGVGKFRRREESCIVDLREIGPKYDWIVQKVRIFDFNLEFSPLESLKMQVPLKEENFIIVSPDFIVHEDDPRPGVLGEYGFGYAFLAHSSQPSVLAYGPGRFDAAIQLINFSVLKAGEIRCRMVFVVNRPDKILKVDIDPIGWSFSLTNLMTFGLLSRALNPVRGVVERVLPLRIPGVDPLAAYISLANLLTDGMAAQQLGITKTELEKRMLVQHFMQHYQMLTGSLLVWRSIMNWGDTENLPKFCLTGVSV